MHKLILGKRNALAHARILKVVQALSEQFEIPDDVAAALKVQEKDAEVRAMKEREAVASLLEVVAESLGIDLNPEPEAELEVVTQVTDPADDPNLNGTDPEAGDGGTPQGEGVPEGTDGDASDLSHEDAAQGDAGDGLPAPDVSAAG